MAPSSRSGTRKAVGDSKNGTPRSARSKSPSARKKKSSKNKSPSKSGNGQVDPELDPELETVEELEELHEGFTLKAPKRRGKYIRCDICTFQALPTATACPRCGEALSSSPVGAPSPLAAVAEVAASSPPVKVDATLSRGGLDTTLTDDQLAALKEIAAKLSAPGKGFLASDESAGPWLRAGHVDAKKIPDTAETRAAYRAMLYTTPGLSEFVSGVILHAETLYQQDATGREMVDLITSNGMLVGLKVDKGYDKAGLPGTLVGPLGHPETWCKGLEDLDSRCAEAYAKGARFAKWRNVLQIDAEKGLPSDLAIFECCHSLSRYAAICQRNGLVPIVEPEIVPNGAHDISVCAAVTEKVLLAQFASLKEHRVYLEGAVLKPNMVKAGLAAPRASPDDVATNTITALKRAVPPELPGIFFLSGEAALDEDNEETATVNLSAMNRLFPSLPWHVSFSYGKALQKTCIVTWMGKEENVAAAQTALYNRCKANSQAAKGGYVAGSCASVGTDGNIQQASGAY